MSKIIKKQQQKFKITIFLIYTVKVIWFVILILSILSSSRQSILNFAYWDGGSSYKSNVTIIKKNDIFR
jgi:hypothetical protein